MAIVKFGPTVVGARGTIAGTIFTANKSGPYARGWSKGANPQSDLQNAHRNLLADIAATWRDLTVAQRDDWIDYADDPAQELTNSLGENYFASGFNWFVRINLNLEAAGAARRVDAPTLVRVAAPIIQAFGFKLTGAATDTVILMTGGSPNLGFLHAVFLQTYSSLGRTTTSAKRTFMTVEIPTAGRAIFFQEEVESAFGTIVLGQVAFLRIQVQDGQGQRGPGATASAESSA